MNSYQAMLLLDEERDHLSLEDAKYMNNERVQLLINKIELLCFKYAMNDDINFKMDYNNELLKMLEGLSLGEQEYLIEYRKRFLQKMQSILYPGNKIYSNNTYVDPNWVYGDELYKCSK